MVQQNKRMARVSRVVNFRQNHELKKKREKKLKEKAASREEDFQKVNEPVKLLL